MQTTTSTDGTRIAYERHGEGPPLVLLHGGSATRQSWDALRPQLADEFTLVVPDRRGRGASDDADDYSLDRETADLRAVLDTIDGDPTVFGHSFGGLVALAAAAEISVDRLVLYEPPVLGDDGEPNTLAARMQEQVDAGERKAAMKLFYREAAGIPAPEQLPIWPEQVQFDLVETVIRENRVVESFDWPVSSTVDSPTLLLTGDHSPAHLREAVQMLQTQLPQTYLAELDGVGHVGTLSAPEQVAAEVREFCRQETPRA